MKKIIMVLLLMLVPNVVFANSFVVTRVSNVPVQILPTDQRVIACITFAGSRVEILGAENNFYKVQFNDVEGYIQKAYAIEAVGEASHPQLREFIESCKKYYRDNGFTYGLSGSIPADASNPQTDCSTYVSWVMYEYGKANGKATLTNSFSKVKRSSDFRDLAKGLSKGETSDLFTLVDGIQNAKYGDILGYENQDGSGHVEFYAGAVYGERCNVYSCGSVSSIKSSNLITSGGKYKDIMYILRLKPLNEIR